MFNDVDDSLRAALVASMPIVNGEVDLAFDPGTGADSHALSCAVTAGGQVLVTGLFDTVNGISRPPDRDACSMM